MSHFATVKTNMKSKAAVLAALEAMGLEYEVSQDGKNSIQAVNYYGQADALSKAAIVVRAATLSRTATTTAERLEILGAHRHRHRADMAFVIDSEGSYNLMIDDYEFTYQHNGFRQRFATEYVRALTAELGYVEHSAPARVTEGEHAGTTRLRLTMAPKPATLRAGATRR